MRIRSRALEGLGGGLQGPEGAIGGFDAVREGGFPSVTRPVPARGGWNRPSKREIEDYQNPHYNINKKFGLKIY
jgi:hypothetical protein